MRKTTLLFFLLLLAVSCKPFEGLVRAPQRQLPLFEVHKGTTGVEMAFIEGAPPAEVYEKNLFEIAVEIENNGGADAEGVTVFGIPADAMTITRGTARNAFRLKGKTGTVPIGERERFVVLAQARELLEERYPAVVTANTCYKYTTSAVELVCVKPVSALQREVREICVPQEKNIQGGQGGPVGIVKIEKPITSPFAGKVKPTIIFHIKNLGSGAVVAQQNYDELCRSNTQLRQREGLVNIVSVNAQLSNQPLACTPNPAVLEEDAIAVSCTLEQGLSAEATYEALLEVELGYGYSEQQTRSVVIKKIL